MEYYVAMKKNTLLITVIKPVLIRIRAAVASGLGVGSTALRRDRREQSMGMEKLFILN